MWGRQALPWQRGEVGPPGPCLPGARRGGRPTVRRTHTTSVRTSVVSPASGRAGKAPAHGREFGQDAAPADAGDFDSWVCRTVLNPGRPLFREARYILAEEPDMRDTALYHAVLAAIADGNTSRGGIAGYLERKSTDLA